MTSWTVLAVHRIWVGFHVNPFSIIVLNAADDITGGFFLPDKAGFLTLMWSPRLCWLLGVLWAPNADSLLLQLCLLS